MIVRIATKNKLLRRKNITIEKLCGNPVLFIGTEHATKQRQMINKKQDSQIIKIESESHRLKTP